MRQLVCVLKSYKVSLLQLSSVSIPAACRDSVIAPCSFPQQLTNVEELRPLAYLRKENIELFLHAYGRPRTMLGNFASADVSGQPKFLRYV